MRIFKLAALALLGLGLTVATTDALAEDVPVAAEEAPTIQDGAIKEFNPTWAKARKLDEDLKALAAKVGEAKAEVNVAAGIGKDAAINKAIEDMKATAGDKLIVALETGSAPKVSATEDAPDNVKAFAVALDKAAGTIQQVLGEATNLKGTATELGTEAAGLPAQITPSILKDNGLKKPADIKAEKTLVGTNVDLIKLIPTAADNVISAATEFLTLVGSLAG